MHVLVATDQSERAPSTAQRWISLLAPPDRVTVLTVLTSVSVVDDEDWEDDPLSPLDEQDRRFRVQMTDATAEFERVVPVFVSAHVEHRIEGGDAGPTICDVARELGVDAIVVGSHTRRGLGRFRLGSVSEHVARHAACPVLIVRADSSASP